MTFAISKNGLFNNFAFKSYSHWHLIKFENIYISILACYTTFKYIAKL